MNSVLAQHHPGHMLCACVCAGELEMWNKAEAALEDALNASGREWVLNPADGAFYGPKIDITGRCGGGCWH